MILFTPNLAPASYHFLGPFNRNIDLAAMLKYNGIKYFLCKLRSGDENTNKKLLKEMTVNIQGFNTQDLRLLLEFLVTINEITLEVKLFAFLAICITTNDNFYATVATYSPLYQKIEATLNRGLPLRSTIVLNFVTALVYTDDGESMYSKRKTLAMHARNLIRVSGCLGVMTAFFTNSMMFPDTWKALCQCIAECCRDCDVNKTQCGHLISLCVQKGLQGYSDVIMVLQSILNDHPRNVQLFLSCNGIQIFSRDMLQNLTCLQLLSFLLKTPQVTSMIRNTDIAENITEILHWNGPHSQKGQWCTIIMYYLDACNRQTQAESAENEEDKRDNTVLNEPYTKAKSAIEDISIIHDVNSSKQTHDDTTTLFRNVVKEILYWKSKGVDTKRAIPFTQTFTDPTKIDNIRMNHSNIPPGHSTQFPPKNTLVHLNVTKQNIHEKKYYQQEVEKELSFSFLHADDTSNPLSSKYKHHFQQEKPSQSRQSYVVSHKTQTEDQSVKYLCEKSVQTNFESTSAALRQLNIKDEKSTLDSKQFKPQVMSTPKSRLINDEHEVIDNSLPNYRRNNPKKRTSSYVPTRHVYKERRRKVYKTMKKSSPVKLATRSMSARFFNAINESCTTLVKTVKNVFTTEKKDSTTNKTSSAKKNVASSSYSFMDYMRKRDAILGEDYIGDSRLNLDKHDGLTMPVKEGNPCRTCNDTTMLKQKLDNNAYLRRTVKKLKLGINLYGCDFNKISKTFWPQDSFMSPTVLYNLYRKLILK